MTSARLTVRGARIHSPHLPMLARSHTALRALALAAAAALAAGACPAGAQEAPPPASSDAPESSETSAPSADGSPAPVPDRCEVLFETMRRTPRDDFAFEGPVTILCGEERIQADRVTVSGRRYVVAEGNVLLVWQGSRIFGTRMEYDLETGQGWVEDAVGQALDDYIFWAERAEKIGDRTIRLKSATVTTCTQPVPYWSFSVSSATITLESYARMWNVRLRASRLPLIYLPYLVWPVKTDRAAGLLFPEFSSTSSRGDAVTQELFIPLGKSADVTLFGRYYTEAGLGGGARFNVLPNRRGQAVLDTFFIDDQVDDRNRYRATFRQTQEFRNGFKLFADLNFLSDFDYFTDFERDVELVTSPTILAKLELARNGAWTSLNVRELRRKQLFSDGSELVQQTLPEIEWRGRTRRLGRTPFYLSFESSLASIQLDGNQQGQPIDANYVRADAFPTLSLPWSPAPWLDVTPTVRVRSTFYTQSQREIADGSGGTTREVLDEDILRTLFGGGIDITGPKFARIFRRPDTPGASQYKHVIEPTISYGYQENYDDLDDIILYDEVDRFSGAGESVNYALTQRLFAKRPRSRPEAAPETGEVLMVPDATTSETRTDDPFDNYLPGAVPDEEAGEEEGEPMPSEPLEIATLEIRQSRSFDNELSFADLDRDGVNEESSPYSDINVVGRYSPSRTVNLDLRGRYNHLYDKFASVTVSGGISRKLARANFSLVHTNGLGVVPQSGFDDMGNPTTTFVDREDDTTLSLTTGFTLFRGKLALDLDTRYRFDRVAGQPAIPTRRWKLRYQTQCCTIYVEQFVRDFGDANDRQDFYLRIDLTGIGRILKVSY